MEELKELYFDNYIKLYNDFYSYNKLSERLKFLGKWGKDEEDLIRQKALELYGALEKVDIAQTAKYGCDIFEVEKERLEIEKKIHLTLSNEIVSFPDGKKAIIVKNIRLGSLEFEIEKVYSNPFYDKIIFLNILLSEEEGNDIIKKLLSEE